MKRGLALTIWVSRCQPSHSSFQLLATPILQTVHSSQRAQNESMLRMTSTPHTNRSSCASVKDKTRSLKKSVLEHGFRLIFALTNTSTSLFITSYTSVGKDDVSAGRHYSPLFLPISSTTFCRC